MRTYITAGVAVAVAAGLIGCGGGSSGDTARTFPQVQVCLFKDTPKGFVVHSRGGDFISENAGVGALQVNAPRNEIQVVLERSALDAETTANQYDGFGLGEVDTFGNVVLAYNKTPTAQERAFVEGCAKPVD